MTSAGDGRDAIGSQNSYEGISDLLKCYICFDSLKDAAMCPHCTKIACYACVKKWISTGKAECPHCRARLLDSDLIKVPSVQDLSDFIRMDPRQPTDKEFCPQHPQLVLTVYCETCCVCICSDCALWGKHRENKGHSIKPLEELYRQQKKILQKKLSTLKEHMREILSLVEHIELSMDDVKSQRNKTQQEIDKIVEDIFGRLNDQLRMKLQKLTDSKRYLKRQACKIGTVSTEIEGKISGSQSLIVSQREELQERLSNALKELESSTMSDLEIKPEVGTFVNEIVPPYETTVFEITDFSKKQQSGKEIFSNLLTYCGLSWRLKIYPNGTGDFTGRYLGVFVELYDGYSQTAMYNYFVEIIHGAGHYKSSRTRPGNFKRDYGSDFAVGEAWGYKKFYEIKNLESNGFLVKDTLLVKFGVRHPTYHQRCRDSTLYTNDLKHKIMALKHQNSQLRQKCVGITEDTDDISITKMKNRSLKAKSSPKDIQDHSFEETNSEKKKFEKKREERVIDETRRESIEESFPPADRIMAVANSQQQQPKLTKTSVSLSQPHLYSMLDSRMHRMEKESNQRSNGGFHQTHSMLVSSPGQRNRHQQHQQPLNYGHCIPPHRRQSDNSEVPQTIREQRRQSYDPSRMQQMMFDHSQSMMLPQHHQMYPAGSLSQADYMMAPSRGSEYYTPFRDNHQEQMDWMGGIPPQSQLSPRRQIHPPSRQDFVDVSQTDIVSFMDDPGSPSTFNGDSNSQLGPEIQELYELSDTLSVSTPPVDNSLISQKMGYSMVEMSQPIDHITYRRKKSAESTNLKDMDHLSRSVQTLHDDSSHKGDGITHRKPIRTQSTLRPSPSNINSMGSEPQLNMYGPPGLQSSILSRLVAPIDQLQQPGNSSTLPHRGSKFTNASHGRSQQRRHNHGNTHNPLKQQGGVATITHPSQSNGGKRTSTIVTTSKQTGTNQSVSVTSLSLANSSSPLQERVQEQSSSNQKLRSSGRSYKMQSKKFQEGRLSPCKSTLTNTISKQSDSGKLNVEIKTTPPDNTLSNRLTVGGNITNNTSLSQLDKLL